MGARWSGVGLAVLPVLCAAGLEAVRTAPVADPFAYLAPTVTLSADERRRAEAGEPILRTLGAESGELVVFGAIRLSGDADRLVAWIRRIADLKRSERVTAIARFSTVPVIDDLAGLTLNPSELKDLRACRPGRCGFKLTADEINEVIRAAAPGPAGDAALEREFRLLVLGRVRRYLAGDVSITRALQPLGNRSTFLRSASPTIGPFLESFPHGPAAGIESFLYWSVEAFGAKPVTGVTHVAIARPTSEAAPEVVVAGRQFFATHYLDAALNLTMVTRPGPRGDRYLVFVNRSRVDVLGGVLSGVKRWAVERKLRGDGRDLLVGLRARLERGAPGER